MTSHIIALTFLLGLIALVVWGFFAFAGFRCNEAWKDSGHASRFNVWAMGCQVEVGGRWVPEQSYREVP